MSHRWPAEASRKRWYRAAAAVAAGVLIIVASVLASALPASAAPPDNDDFADAADATPAIDACGGLEWFEVQQSLDEATAQDGEPQHTGQQAAHSIWFTVDLPYPSRVYVDASGGDRGGDAGRDDLRVAAYRGDSLTTLTAVGIADANGEDAWVEATVPAGSLFIAVDADQPLPVVVDQMVVVVTRATRLPITGDSGSMSCNGHNGWPALEWTAPRSGPMTFSAITWVQVRDSSGDVLTRDEDPSFGDDGHKRTPRADFWATRGETYRIRVNGGPVSWRRGFDHPDPRADFDGDGCEDIAVGVPSEDVGGTDAGAVVVRSGCRSHTMRLHQDTPGVPSQQERGDRFGAALAAGDFDADGFADLAVGIPGEDVEDSVDAGSVMIFPGSPDGLVAAEAWRIRQDAADGPLSNDEAGDRFGAALASRALGDPPGVVEADLIVGVPGEDRNGRRDTGFLGVVNASQRLRPVPFLLAEECPLTPVAGARVGEAVASGLLTDGTGWDSRDVAAGQPGGVIEGVRAGGVVYAATDERCPFEKAGQKVFTPRAGDQLGSAITVSDTADDHLDEVVIGAPGRDVNGRRNAGGVVLVPAGASWDSRLVTQGSGAPGTPEAGDRFGASLAAGFFNRDTFGDVLVGAPGEDVGDKADAGTVTILFGRAGATTFRQGHNGVVGKSERGDRFGAAVEALDLSANFLDEWLAGAPGEDVGSVDAAGRVTWGTRSGRSSTIDASKSPGGAEPGDHFGAALLH